MNKSIYIINKNSNEIYALTYPRSIQNFCEYDFSYFHDRCVDLCNEAIKTGDFDREQLTELRASLKGCHIYYEQNIRLLFEKIVTDCWIDYLCRKDSVGTSVLWNRYMGCSTPFERAMFNRLCEYRYNHAINQWLNIIRIQEYARKKLDFLFDIKASGVNEIKIRRNYFDLMFNVTACELGCDEAELGTTCVCTSGRIPNSQFIMSALAKDILRSNLSELNYEESFDDVKTHGELSDQLAMDAFARMKGSLPKQIDAMNIAERSMKNLPDKVYMPSSFKAVIDLEFDVLLEDGAVLQHCATCGRYYVKDSEYTSDYCNKVSANGMTCLEIYERDNPRSKIPTELKTKCDEAEIYMLNRMGKDLSRAEYDGWRVYLHAMMEKVESGEMQKDELESFVEYSKKVDISRSEPVKAPVVQKEQVPHGVKTVRPFVPERVDRSVLEEQQQRMSQPEPYMPFSFAKPRQKQQEQKPEARPVSVVQRGAEKPSTTRIIRGGTQSARTLESVAPRFSQNTEPPLAKPEPQKQSEVVAAKTNTTPDKPIEEEFDEFLPFIKTTGIKKNAAAITAYGKAVNTAEQVPEELETLIASKTEKAEVAVKKNEFDNPFANVSSIFDGIEQGDDELMQSPDTLYEKKETQPSVIHNAKAAQYKAVDFTDDFSDNEIDKAFIYKHEDIPEETQSNVSAPEKRDSSVPNGIWTEERGLFLPADETENQGNDELSMLISRKEQAGKQSQKTPKESHTQRTTVKRKSTNKTQHVFDAILKDAPNSKNKR